MLKVFKEIPIGKFALRFYPSDNGWMCGISKEMMSALESLADNHLLLPHDPTPGMKQAAIKVELFDNETGKDYTLSWNEVEEIYSVMLNAFEDEND
jgi:hypothetical protein